MLFVAYFISYFLWSFVLQPNRFKKGNDETFHTIQYVGIGQLINTMKCNLITSNSCLYTRNLINTIHEVAPLDITDKRPTKKQFVCVAYIYNIIPASLLIKVLGTIFWLYALFIFVFSPLSFVFTSNFFCIWFKYPNNKIKMHTKVAVYNLYFYFDCSVDVYCL